MNARHILIVDDESDIRDLVSEILVDEGYRVTTASNAAEADLAYRKAAPDLVLLDIWMPDTDGISLLENWRKNGDLSCPVVMLSGHGNIETAVHATRLGAHDFIEKPVSLSKLLAMIEDALAAPATPDRHPDAAAAHLQPPQGNSTYRKTLRRQLQNLAENPHHFSITGEPGTCALEMARWVHARSHIADQPFLHGHQAMEPPLVEREQAATVCITTPALMDSGRQQRLYRWLNGDLGQTRRLIICCTSSMEDLRRHDALLPELYDLVGGAAIVLQPLRHHQQDVPELLRYYSEILPDREQLPYRAFSLAAQNYLRQYEWPGNELQLRSFVRQLLLVGDKQEISREEAEQQLLLLQQRPLLSGIDGELFNQPLRQARESFERQYLAHHLRQSNGSVGALAEKVGMERTHLYRKLRGLGLDPRQLSHKS